MDCLVSSPSLVGYYSLDANRAVKFDYSGLQYVYEGFKQSRGGLTLNLNDGIESKIDKSTEDERIDHILKWCDREKPKDVDIVCLRGLLKTLLSDVAENDNGWTISAECVDGVIYLWMTKEEQVYTGSEKFSYWGHKFERFILSCDPQTPPDTRRIVNLNEEFCGVFTCTLGPHRLLYGAEIDGVISDRKIAPDLNQLKTVEFVELKTSYDVNFEVLRSKKKLYAWFFQSAVVGVNRVLCGFRDNKGIVKRTELVTLERLKSVVGAKEIDKGEKNCMNVLNLIKKTVFDCKEREHKLFIFNWVPQSRIRSQIRDMPSRRSYIRSRLRKMLNTAEPSVPNPMKRRLSDTSESENPSPKK